MESSRFEPTRTSLHQVAIHIVARARVQATGRFSLRVAPGGFGTPEFGPSPRRVRVSGSTLVIDDDAQGAPASAAIAIDGRSLADLARVAGVDLDEELDVGHDTTDIGDVGAPLTVHDATACELADWFALSAAALDRLLLLLDPDADPTPARLWPEHFDVAIDAAARPGVRANFGGSPGDTFSDEPYLYAGPWTADRPGDAGFWNAPFGAVAVASQIADVDAAVEFFTAALGHLRS